MSDTFTYDPTGGSVDMDLLAEQRQALSALSTAATGFAKSPSAVTPAPERWHKLLDTAFRCLPSAQHAAVVGLTDTVQLLADANDQVMAAWIGAERELGSGPIHDVLARREPVVCVNELYGDPRWYDLAKFLETPTTIHSLLAVGLADGASTVALTLCSTWPFAFDDTSQDYATLLAAIYSLAHRVTA